MNYSMNCPMNGQASLEQDTLIGHTIGRFKPVTELGRGGMGVVYKAHQPDLDRMVALKVLLPEWTHDSKQTTLFRHEARNAAALEHPHIIPLYDIGEVPHPSATISAVSPPPDMLHYIAMKYIRGYSLKDLIAKEHHLSLSRTVEILDQVAQPLDYAHEHGIIHRDIKPSNLMMTKDGWVYLTDFGLAWRIGTMIDPVFAGTVIGTPAYMSPEQAQGRLDLLPASDVYTLAVVAYEMLSGTLPFNDEASMAVLAAHIMDEPPHLCDVAPSLPAAVGEVVMRGLQKEPANRYQRAGEFVDALREAVGRRAVPKRTTPTSPTVVLSRQHAEKSGYTDKTHLIPDTNALQLPQPPSDSTPSSLSKPLSSPSRFLREPTRKPWKQHIARRVSALLVLVVVGGGGIAWSSDFTLESLPFTIPEPHFHIEMPSFGVFSSDDTHRHNASPSPAEGHADGENRLLPPRPRSIPSMTTAFAASAEEKAETERLLFEGWERFEQGQYQLAEEIFQEVAERQGGKPKALVGLGWVLLQRGAYEQAETMLSDALRHYENQPIAHTGLGWVAYQLQDYPAAVSHFDRAVVLDTSYANAWYGLGKAREQQERFADARDAYQRALIADPGDTAAQQALQSLANTHP